MYLPSIKSVDHNAAKSVNRSILKKSRHIGFGVFIDHLSMAAVYRKQARYQLSYLYSWIIARPQTSKTASGTLGTSRDRQPQERHERQGRQHSNSGDAGNGRDAIATSDACYTGRSPTVPKIRFMYSQKWICVALFAVPTFMYLWAIYKFPGSVYLFGYSTISRPTLGII